MFSMLLSKQQNEEEWWKPNDSGVSPLFHPPHCRGGRGCLSVIGGWGGWEAGRTSKTSTSPAASRGLKLTATRPAPWFIVQRARLARRGGAAEGSTWCAVPRPALALTEPAGDARREGIAPSAATVQYHLQLPATDSLRPQAWPLRNSRAGGGGAKQRERAI